MNVAGTIVFRVKFGQVQALVMPGPEARLTWFERLRIGLEVLVTYVRVRWWLVRLSFPKAVEAARGTRRATQPSPASTATAALRLGGVVQRTLGALPLDAKCLIRSLVLTRMLARRGIEATLVLGVRAKPEFAAHAWVELDGTAILPTTREFHRIADY